MPPFVSAELARDSPLDELAFRRSASSVSISSVASSARPNSLPILDAFPLSPELERGPLFEDFRLDRSNSRFAPSPAPNLAPHTAAQHHSTAEAQNPAPSRSPIVADPHYADGGLVLEAAAEDGVPVSSHEDSRQHVSQPSNMHETARPNYSSHSRASSTDTILPAPDHASAASPLSLSRTQKRYMRYGHSYSGSQGYTSPGTSPGKPIPPALGPTWRSLGLVTNSAPNSAASTAVEPMIPPPLHARATHGPRSPRSPAANHPPSPHVRAPSQPGFRYAHPSAAGAPFSLPPASNSGSGSGSGSGSSASQASASPFRGVPPSTNFGSDSPAAFSHSLPRPMMMAPVHTHGSSQSWDASSSMRIRVPTLPSAAEHLREGSSALAVDSRLTLEHWAAAASRFGSAAGNLLLELGWAERWIPWTIIGGLDLPVKMNEVDPAELKFGVAPCIGRVADALHSYGVRLRVRQQEAAALRAFELAQSLGSTEAAFSAAHMCLKGGRHAKKDLVKARSLLRGVNDI